MEFKVNDRVCYKEHLGTIIEYRNDSCLVSFDDNWSSKLYTKGRYNNCYVCPNFLMEKSDPIHYIKPGLIVELTNGEIGIVVSYEEGWYILIINNLCYCYSSDFDNNLNCCHDCDYSIKTIYKAIKPIGFNVEKSIKNCSIIWTREKSFELTVQEIANKFGIPVEQLKIKK